MNSSVALMLSAFFTVVSLICVGIWTYRDSKRKNLNSRLWTALAVLIPYCIGFLVYIIVNPKQNAIQCSYCGNVMKKNIPVCGNCGAAMVTAKQSISPASPADKKILIGYILSVVAVAVFFVLAIVLLFI